MLRVDIGLGRDEEKTKNCARRRIEIKRENQQTMCIGKGRKNGNVIDEFGFIMSYTIALEYAKHAERFII